MEALEFLHAVEHFIGRDLSREDGDAVIEMADEGYTDVQHVAELVMTREDYQRVYGHHVGVGKLLSNVNDTIYGGAA